MAEERDRRPALLVIVVVLAVVASLALCSSKHRDEAEPTLPRPTAAPAAPPRPAADEPFERDSTAADGDAARERVHAEPPQEPRERLVLEVLVTDGGRPVAGARVRALADTTVRSRRHRHLIAPHPPVANATSGDDGIARLPLATRTPVRVLGQHGARAVLSDAVRPPNTSPSRLEIALQDGLHMRGRVLRGGDRPVEGAVVSIPLVGAYYGLGYRNGVGLTATTDEHGAFDVGYLPDPRRNETYLAMVRGQGFAETDAELDMAAVRADRLVIRVRGWVNVRGTVMRRDGIPAAGARVSLGETESRCEEDGTFELRDVADDIQRLRVLGPRSRGLSIDVGPFPDLGNDLGELRVGLAGVIGGRVVDEEGEPVAGAAITCGTDDWFRRTSVTDDLGRFEVFDVCGERHDVGAMPPEKHADRLEGLSVHRVPTGMRDLEIVLRYRDHE